MEPVRVLIADDEVVAVHYLRLMLSHYGNLTVVGCARNGREAIHILHNEAVDLVFMDVLMPKLNGIDVLKQFNKSSALVPPIFVMHTAYHQFASDAYQHRAFAYLQKPISSALLHQTLQDIFMLLQRNPCERLQQQHPKLKFHVGNSTTFIDEHEIILIEAAGNYACIKTRYENFIVRETLKQLLQRLPKIFVQVHRSVLINLLHVNKVISASVNKIVMSDATEVTATPRYKMNWQPLIND